MKVLAQEFCVLGRADFMEVAAQYRSVGVVLYSEDPGEARDGHIEMQILEESHDDTECAQCNVKVARGECHSSVRVYLNDEDSKSTFKSGVVIQEKIATHKMKDVKLISVDVFVKQS